MSKEKIELDKKEAKNISGGTIAPGSDLTSLPLLDIPLLDQNEELWFRTNTDPQTNTRTYQLVTHQYQGNGQFVDRIVFETSDPHHPEIQDFFARDWSR